MTVRIGMVDADLLDGGTRHPNLAQMKIAQYCIRNGCDTTLIYGKELDNLDEYDLIIISKVFDFTKLPPCLDFISKMSEDELHSINLDIGDTVDAVIAGKKHPHEIIGGTGFFFDDVVKLPERIEHIMPYYDLYKQFVNDQIASGKRDRAYYNDYLDFSIGFATRGCFRHCPFCVNRNSNGVRKHSPISEFYDPGRPMIYLWDDNFLGYKNGWKEILDELNAIGKPFQFRQGLDMRIMNDEKAKALAESHYYGDFIFAFDHIEDKNIISKKLEIWRRYNTKETKLYVLTGFDAWNADHGSPPKGEQEDIRTTFERIKILMSYHCLPYIMKHKDYARGRYKGVYTEIARWCNQPNIFKKMSFRDFCYGNQRYSKSGRPCAAMRAYMLLEKEMPDVIEEYCYLRYEGYPQIIDLSEDIKYREESDSENSIPVIPAASLPSKSKSPRKTKASKGSKSRKKKEPVSEN
jgi:hypothetical protein